METHEKRWWRRRESNRDDTVRQEAESDRDELLTPGNDAVSNDAAGTKPDGESELDGMGCTNCTKEQPEAPGVASGGPQATQISVAELLRVALTELARGEAVAVRALLCRALARLEAGR